jgi:hypothetical protein
MKRIGIAAAILIIALLMTGVASALASNEAQEKTIMIRGTGHGTAVTSDGQVFKVIFHDVNNETPFGTKGGGSRSLAPGVLDIWGSYSWTAGTSVQESATWTPTSQHVLLGIYDNVEEEGPFLEYSNGSGSFSTNVPWTSSDWGYAIANPGPQTIQYTLTY